MLTCGVTYLLKLMVISLPLQMPGITWAMPTPIADTVSPSASLCSEPLMINWERITDRLRMAFPQQTRYFDFSLVVTLVLFFVFFL